MKKRLSTGATVLSLLLLACVAASAATRTVVLRVKGMTCGGCATTVEQALKATEDVESASVSFERARAVVKYDHRKVTVAKLREVIESVGFSCDAEGRGGK
ncbi:MAG TPA: heavy metal-associated domain-containing protein [Pyrinomonadaceae bacterium]|nr:heavy metal-associated domain-containing protein [Pyrinomonadaceae bacterium]